MPEPSTPAAVATPRHPSASPSPSPSTGGTPPGARGAGWERLVPGLLLTVVGVLVGWSVNDGFAAVSPLTASVALGVVAANIHLPERCRPGLAWGARHLLRAGIVLLGLQLAVSNVLALGWQTLVLVVIVVFATFFGTQWFGRRLGLPGRQPLLIATGFAICGASAVAAMDAVTRDETASRADTERDEHDEHDVVVAVALVTICGSLAIAVLPLLRHPLGLDTLQFGHWVGASVHDIGQVVATATVAGPAALKSAIVVKLMRIVMLAPMVMGTSLWRRRRMAAAARASGDASAQAAVVTGRKPAIVPLFVLGFLAMIAVRSSGQLPARAVADAQDLQNLLLAGGLFGLGCGVRVRSLLRTGYRPLLVALVSWLLIAAISYGGVLLTT